MSLTIFKKAIHVGGAPQQRRGRGARERDDGDAFSLDSAMIAKTVCTAIL